MLLVVSLVSLSFVLGDVEEDSTVVLALFDFSTVIGVELCGIVDSAVVVFIVVDCDPVVDFAEEIDPAVVVTSGVVDFSVVDVVTSGVVDPCVVVDSVVVTIAAVAAGFSLLFGVVDFSVVDVVTSGVVDVSVVVDTVVAIASVVAGVSMLLFVCGPLETSFAVTVIWVVVES